MKRAPSYCSTGRSATGVPGRSRNTSLPSTLLARLGLHRLVQRDEERSGVEADARQRGQELVPELQHLDRAPAPASSAVTSPTTSMMVTPWRVTLACTWSPTRSNSNCASFFGSPLRLTARRHRGLEVDRHHRAELPELVAVHRVEQERAHDLVQVAVTSMRVKCTRTRGSGGGVSGGGSTCAWISGSVRYVTSSRSVGRVRARRRAVRRCGAPGSSGSAPSRSSLVARRSAVGQQRAGFLAGEPRAARPSCTAPTWRHGRRRSGRGRRASGRCGRRWAGACRASKP